MLKLFQQVFDHIGIIFKGLSPGRRVSLVAMFLIIAAASVALLMWAFRQEYQALYSDLSLEDSGAIVEQLTDEHIPYRLEQEGRRILVPASKVYELRLRLAGKELPRERGTGWELFDKPSLGVTDFVQRLNYRRGLEGELARTILQLEPVEAVRVHLVIPEESLFRENQKEPMASVTLRLRHGHRLSGVQVEGVTFLVSSAVEGLAPGNVTMVDSRGYLLSERTEVDQVMRLTATQINIQKQVEANLVNKGQALLDKRFGPGRSAIQVTADLDFQQREQTREFYDADNPAVRSEEVVSSSAVGSDTSSTRSENTITNYELNLTREHMVNPVGSIRRMTIAAMVDGSYETAVDPQSNKEVREFIPLSSMELDEVAGTIKSALGFTPERGDEISVVSVPFQEVGLIEEGELVTGDRWDLVFRYGQKAVTLIAIVLLLLIVRSFLRRAQAATGRLAPQPQLAPGEAPGAALPPAAGLGTELTPEARSDALLLEQVTKFAQDKPETVARLVKSWLVEM